MTTRREFIGAGAAILGASAAGASAAITPADEKLDILFLGGTGFLGPHQVNYALDRGHNVTVFNRGNKSGLFGNRVEELSGDRDAGVGDGLKALQGKRTWDVVVDNKGPLHEPLDPSIEDVTGETYGPLKAECDRNVQAIYGDSCTVVRPTYVVGPGDHTDRFTYWVERFQTGGEVLCPASPDFNIDWIDARDLCHWLVRLGENDMPGVFNGTGPGQHVSRENFMWALRLSSAEKSNLHWPSRELMEKTGFPTPMIGNGQNPIFIDPSAAQEAGLTYRSLADTVHDTHEWWMSQSEERRAAPLDRTGYRRWPSVEEEAAVIAQID